METDTILNIFVDGSFEPSHRRGGWGLAVMRSGVEIAHDFGGTDNADSGGMEVEAILNALEWLQEHAPTEKSIIWSDSVHAVTGCNNWRHIWRNNGWKRQMANGTGRRRTIANADIWQKIDRLLTQNTGTRVEWCKGHANFSGNERAHELAAQGRMKKR